MIIDRLEFLRNEGEQDGRLKHHTGQNSCTCKIKRERSTITSTALFCTPDGLSTHLIKSTHVNLSVRKSEVAKKGTLTFFHKKDYVLPFLATLWLPRLKEMPTFANTGSKEQRVWHRKKK